jgi:hypothetical protein
MIGLWTQASVTTVSDTASTFVVSAGGLDAHPAIALRHITAQMKVANRIVSLLLHPRRYYSHS